MVKLTKKTATISRRAKNCWISALIIARPIEPRTIWTAYRVKTVAFWEKPIRWIR